MNAVKRLFLGDVPPPAAPWNWDRMGEEYDRRERWFEFWLSFSIALTATLATHWLVGHV